MAEQRDQTARRLIQLEVLSEHNGVAGDVGHQALSVRDRDRDRDGLGLAVDVELAEDALRVRRES